MENNNLSKICYLIRRSAAVVLSLLLAAAMLVPADEVYAAKGSGGSKDAADEAVIGMPIREVHRVKVGDKKYCCFVQSNVVLTPAEIQKLSDNELVEEIVRRTGLYMKLTNCRKSSHSAITADEWIRKGGSFMLSDADIARIRDASPSNGNPAYLYMDLLISTEPAEADTAAEDKQEEPEAGNAEEDNTAADEDKTDASKSDESGKADDKTADSKTDEGEADSDKAEEAASDAEPVAEETAGDKDKSDEAVDDGKKGESGQGKSSVNETAQDTGGNAAEKTDSNTKADSQTQPAKKTRKTYSTHKLLSPNLLFIAVATESDAGAGEDNCAEDKTPAENMNIPDVSADAEPEDMLPEYRTIQMADRKGAPLEPTLQDGTPVSLKWIEPHKGLDAGRTDHLSAGIIGALAALAIAAAAAAVIIIRRRAGDEYEEYEEDE